MSLENHLPIVAVAEDPFVCRYVSAVLTRYGFREIVEHDVSRTRRLMETGALKPDVLITNTPGAFVRFAQDLPVVYLAALPDRSQVEGFRDSRILRKPFLAQDLAAAVNQLAAPVVT